MDISGPGLARHEPTQDFFIAMDSDGCVFDTMELKQRQCFIPNTIAQWNLEGIWENVGETTEYVTLYSENRGANRFVALVNIFDHLAERQEVGESGVVIPDLPGLRKWIDTEPILSNAALEAYCRNHDAPDLREALAWSEAVNAAVAETVKGVSPFPYAGQALEKAAARADILVCSTAPFEAVERNWKEEGLDRYVFAMGGQEHGKKPEQIALAATGKYEPSRMLMVGDAPGDLGAAQANNAHFYPINPGDEERSWKRFVEEALDRFFDGAYGGDYESSLVREFEACLDENPPWIA